MVELRMAGAAAFLALALVGTPALAQGSAPPASQYQNLLTPLMSGNETIIGQPIAYPTGTPNVTAAIVTIPPGGDTGWHIHDVPLFVYILEGEVDVDYGTEGVHHVVAGDAFLEAFQWPHNATNHSDAPVKILAFYMGADGLANATPVDGPAPSAKLDSAQDHVVAMNHFRPARIAQYRLDFRTVAATDPFGIGGVESDQPTPDLLTLGAHDADSIAALERTLDPGHAGRQQAFAGAQSARRSGVDHHRAVGFEVPGNPFLARGARLHLGEEPGAAAPAGDGREGMQTMTVGDHHRGAGGGRDPRRLDLGPHTATG